MSFSIGTQANLLKAYKQSQVPFLNWCLIVMMLGINIQKMVLKDLEAPLELRR
ncbi:hypothetical protein [Photobacterium leiognathi]|uniref:hypothetical protein n=1 Tax=Photobacterium leiognathi TaxID=553611 RepID=UPI0027344D21|nr:hypothetical protein [Photobacterium leiognathi]